MRLAYFGLPLAAELLAEDGHDFCFAALSPVAAPGRRRLERTLGPRRIFDAATLGKALEGAVDVALESEHPELLVSWFWTRRLPARWLEAARFGGIGVHPSLLPRHRGPDPYFWAIDAGDAESGVTVHRLTERYDDGDIVSQRALPIGERNAWQLARALDRPSLALLRECVAKLERGEGLGAASQDEARATWAPAPSGAELRADFRWPTERVLRRVRALSPAPGLALDVEGFRLVVTAASMAETFPAALEAGEAGVVGDPPVLVVRTSDGAIRVDSALIERADRDSAISAEEAGAAVAAHLAGPEAQRAGDDRGR